MTKWIVSCLIVTAGLASSAWAANDFSSQLLSATDLEGQINAMDTQTYNTMAPHDFECFARNERGERFRGFGRFPDRAQRDAMDACYRRSRSCMPEGCHPI